jgi:hypothetical protein
MPILPGTDYDLSLIETNRYAPIDLARRSEMHDLDVLATSEQLLSSVDVHVSETARPFWDSGSIVSAQGIGQYDAKNVHRERLPTEMAVSDNAVLFPYSLSQGSGVQGLGKGQRVLRTPEGYLHVFNIKRSVKSGESNTPVWTHMKKPLYGDVFFNRRSLKTNPDTSSYDAKDECGPHLVSDVGIDTQSSFGARTRLYGAAYAADSNGTIHAVIEVHGNPDDTNSHQAHWLYYTKADRYLVSSNPEPVYDWDWSVHTPVIINPQAKTDVVAGGTRWDIRYPSLVCDSKDRLHLTVTQVLTSSNSDYDVDLTRILYTVKQPEDANFPEWNPASGTGLPVNELWSVVSKDLTDATDATANQASAGPHATSYASASKVCLRSDDLPVVFFWGSPMGTYTTSTRRSSAVYANIGQVGTGGNFTFDTSKVYHVDGIGPDSRNGVNSAYGVKHYDAIVDERDRAVVVTVKADRRTASGKTFAERQTMVTVFDTRRPLSDQYTSTDGLGDHRTLFLGPTYNGSTELRHLDTFYENPTLTTNGKGEYHLVMGFTITGHDPARRGALYRDTALSVDSSVSPLIFPGTPLSASGGTLFTGGYAQVSGDTLDWSGIRSGPTPWYANGLTTAHRHMMHVWFPSYEFDDDSSENFRVVRSVNIRWLSVPSLRYDSTKGWQPIGSAQTLAGNEDFPHLAGQIRYQRFWGYDASEIDLTWKTNELSWYRTPHAGSALFMPSYGGALYRPGRQDGDGEGVPGFPNGV